MSVRMSRGLPGLRSGVGPDEPLVGHPEVEAVAVDLSDHHGRVTDIATSLLTATDGILGTHSIHQPQQLRTRRMFGQPPQRSLHQRRTAHDPGVVLAFAQNR
jgi:hypothetical protein